MGPVSVSTVVTIITAHEGASPKVVIGEHLVSRSPSRTTNDAMNRNSAVDPVTHTATRPRNEAPA